MKSAFIAGSNLADFWPKLAPTSDRTMTSRNAQLGLTVLIPIEENTFELGDAIPFASCNRALAATPT